MPQAQDITATRFRAAWRNGEGYRVGDVVARGLRCYEAIARHTSGASSEPGHGDAWAEFWQVFDTDTTFRAGARGPHLHVIASKPQAVQPARAPQAIDGEVLAPGVGLASQIIDDSDPDGCMNVAFALDALRQHLRRVSTDLALVQSERVPVAGDDPLLDEFWRRQCALFGAETRDECMALMGAALWEWMRLVRKQLRGEAWSAHEVARNATLEALDLRKAALEQAYRRLRDAPPLDVTADRHWEGV